MSKLPTLRDLVAQESDPDTGRVPGEEKLWAVMPGDPVQEHLLHTEPNPYYRMPYSELKELIASGQLTPEERREAETGLKMQRAFHQEGIERIR